jgi:pilus assembly protein Flp/PilA
MSAAAHYGQNRNSKSIRIAFQSFWFHVPGDRVLRTTLNCEEKAKMVKLNLLIHSLMSRVVASDEGQDLVEYALVVALIAFAATAGMNSLAGDINSAFVAVGGALTIV